MLSASQLPLACVPDPGTPTSYAGINTEIPTRYLNKKFQSTRRRLLAHSRKARENHARFQREAVQPILTSNSTTLAIIINNNGSLPAASATTHGSLHEWLPPPKRRHAGGYKWWEWHDEPQ